MIIGICSDSHGKAGRLEAALRTMAEHNAQAVVHCGDVGSLRCVQLLGACGRPAYLVPGNMDRRLDRLAEAAAECNVVFHGEVLTVPAGGRQLAVTHGHDESVLRELIGHQQFAYVCHGHTHAARDERIGATRVINPGALHHPRQPHHPTLAILDTDADTLQQVTIK